MHHPLESQVCCPSPPRPSARSVSNRGLWECTYLTFAPHFTAEKFILALLHPDPAHRLIAEHVLSHTWPTRFAAPTEHDRLHGLCGLHENFDLHARWRNAIGAAMSPVAKSNDANNNKTDQLTLSSGDEDDNKSRSVSPSRCATPDTIRLTGKSKYLAALLAGISTMRLACVTTRRS